MISPLEIRQGRRGGLPNPGLSGWLALCAGDGSVHDMERPIFSPQVATFIIFGKEQRREDGGRETILLSAYRSILASLKRYPCFSNEITRHEESEHGASLVRKKEIILRAGSTSKIRASQGPK